MGSNYFCRQRPNIFNSVLAWLTSWQKRLFNEIVMRLQFILHACTQTPHFCTCSPNQTVCWCMMFYFLSLLFSSSDYIPQCSCQMDVWSRLMLKAARCLFSLSSQIFKQKQPALQQPGGMCANSNSPVGSLAITAPLLYPCNCKGSCFLSDQTASLPPGRLASSPLAAPGKWGCFAEELNKGCSLIEQDDSYLTWTITFAPWLAVLHDGWDSLLEASA